MIIFLLIIFFSVGSCFLQNRCEKKTKSSLYAYNSFLDWSIDEYDDDIQLLEHEDAIQILTAWEKLSQWKNEEIKKYMHIAKIENPDDIFLGYTPLHNSQRKLIYLFHSKLSVKDTGPYLTVLSGICCPHDSTLFKSKHFKETLERQLTILPIDFTPLMNDPRFGLSWSLDNREPPALPPS